jgi:transmembrane sensor
VGEKHAINPQAIDAWTNGRLVYDNAKLSEIIADANRYTDAKIVFAAQDLRELELSIAFKAENISQMLDNLAEILPVTINRDLPGTVVLAKAVTNNEQGSNDADN